MEEWICNGTATVTDGEDGEVEFEVWTTCGNGFIIAEIWEEGELIETEEFPLNVEDDEIIEWVTDFYGNAKIEE